MPKEQISWVLEQPGAATNGQPRSLYNETGARRRRAHQKSRKGCLNCKKRRIKCDEGRPTCGQCLERRWHCDFPGADAPSAPSSPLKKRRKISPPVAVEQTQQLDQAPLTPVSGSDGVSSIKEAKHAKVLNFMDRAGLPPPTVGEQPNYRREDALELVDHFEDCPDNWLGSPFSQGLIQRGGVEMSFKAPYLLHAILAYSAKHLSFLYPDEQKYSVAATIHYTRSLQEYSSQLVYHVEQGNANALLAASGILAKLSFINTPVMMANTPLAAATVVPAWIRSMQGVKTIMSTPVLRKTLEGGVMAPIWNAYFCTPNSESNLPNDSVDADGSITAMKALKELCSADGDCPSNPGTPLAPSPFEMVLKRLEPLVLLPHPSHEKVDQFLAFIATMEPSFIELLERNEPRALLVLAFWCARMPLIEQWWTGPSAKLECRRICAHLAQNADGRIRALLKFPARSCGFEVDEVVGKEAGAEP
jgi:hypothetical protein